MPRARATARAPSSSDKTEYSMTDLNLVDAKPALDTPVPPPATRAELRARLREFTDSIAAIRIQIAAADLKRQAATRRRSIRPGSAGRRPPSGTSNASGPRSANASRRYRTRRRRLKDHCRVAGSATPVRPDAMASGPEVVPRRRTPRGGGWRCARWNQAPRRRRAAPGLRRGNCSSRTSCPVRWSTLVTTMSSTGCATAAMGRRRARRR